MRKLFIPILAAGLMACGGDDTSQTDNTAAGEVAESAADLFSGANADAADLITGATIRDTIAELASDRYQGRGPGSEGDQMARDYLVEQMSAMGLQPGAADGSWEQPFDLVSVHADQPPAWEFVSGGERLALRQSTEYIVGSGVQMDQSTVVESELVFVGFGIEAPEYQWDDFKGVDLSGKTLVMLNNDPDWDADLFEGDRRLYYGRWTYKYESAARQGAVAAIIIHTTPSAGYPWQVVQTSWTGPQFELPAKDEPRLQVAAWVTEEAAGKLMRMGDQDLAQLVESARSPEFEPVALGVTTSITLRNEIAGVQSANVLGLLPGSDPELADEVVVYTAHHDHLGVGLPNFAVDAEDRIYNGARDNASGTGMVLNIARAFATLPEAPPRSILFAFVGAEEQGLLGAKFFARYPTFPAGKIAGNVNFDSANIWGETTDITYIGKGKSSLDQVADRVAAREGRVVKGDQFPDKGLFYRSDQFALAKIGVPALYLSGGTEFVGRPEGWGAEQIGAYTTRNYHQPSDELTDDWNFDGMVRDARFGFWCGLVIASDPEMPSWNPGDEFEAARQAALLAAGQP
ncbi:MAG: M28 family peptidase [Xanthomonadales bacterium]|nr:M28 family peptidase [Xanthomonadales bacterium]